VLLYPVIVASDTRGLGAQKSCFETDLCYCCTSSLWPRLHLLRWLLAFLQHIGPWIAAHILHLAVHCRPLLILLPIQPYKFSFVTHIKRPPYRARLFFKRRYSVFFWEDRAIQSTQRKGGLVDPAPSPPLVDVGFEVLERGRSILLLARRHFFLCLLFSSLSCCIIIIQCAKLGHVPFVS